MNSQQMITSAALYFKGSPSGAVSCEWLDRACEWLGGFKLSPVLFTADGGEFAFDDCYVLADPKEELVKFGALIKGRRHELTNALRRGVIQYLGMDVPREDAKWRSEWRATIHVSSEDAYLGIEDDLDSDPSALLRRAHAMCEDLADIRYGIAYKMPLADDPASYAIGSGPFSLADFREEMRLRSEGIQRPPSRLELWRDELMGKKRYLTGHFRGAYPASVLSNAHVEAADLVSRPLGKLTKLHQAHWLWELTESEIPRAETMLKNKKLLISEAT